MTVVGLAFMYLMFVAFAGMLLDVVLSKNSYWGAALVTIVFLPFLTLIGTIVVESTKMVFGLSFVLSWPVVGLITLVLLFVVYLIFRQIKP